MKKHKIKRVVSDIISGYSVVEIEAEIYEYKGVQFGIYWKNEPEKAIHAIELYTGCLIGAISCRGTKSPRKDLLQNIADLVDNHYESTISILKCCRERRRRELNVKIHKLELERDCLAFPANERIEL